jgi:hypothetical protein
MSSRASSAALEHDRPDTDRYDHDEAADGQVASWALGHRDATQ